MNTNKSGFVKSETSEENTAGNLGIGIFFSLLILALAAYVYFQMGI